MIRPSQRSDTDELCLLAEATTVFKSHELVALREVLNDYFDENYDEHHYCVTLLHGSQIVGFAYYAKTAMTDNTWHVWWIAVQKATQGQGFGKQLMKYIESFIQKEKGRIVLIETSSLPNYDATRQFYEKLQYEKAAVLADFYADGDSQVIYRKRLAAV